VRPDAVLVVKIIGTLTPKTDRLLYLVFCYAGRKRAVVA
jgi:hypothetical protein